MILTVISLVLGSLRIYGIKHIVFQALAHVFMGYLFCDGFKNKQHISKMWFIILSVVEVICFTIGKIYGT